MSIIAGFAVLAACTGISLWIGYRMQKQYFYRYLTIFWYCMIFWFISGFINIAGGNLTRTVLAPRISETEKLLIRFVLIILQTPFILLALYFLLLFILGILQIHPRPWIKSVFITVLAFDVFLSLYVIWVYLKNGQPGRTVNIFRSLDLVALIIIYLTFFLLLWGSFRIQDKDFRKITRSIAFFFLVYFSLYIFIGSGMLRALLGKSRFAVISFLYFSIHIPPLLIMRRYFLKAHRPFVRDETTLPLLRDHLARHRISPRESEIIDLVLKGRTNAEIEAELFISLKTVKVHLYNIYQKMGVKSRLELVKNLMSLQQAEEREQQTLDIG